MEQNLRVLEITYDCYTNDSIHAYILRVIVQRVKAINDGQFHFRILGYHESSHFLYFIIWKRFLQLILSIKIPLLPYFFWSSNLPRLSFSSFQILASFGIWSLRWLFLHRTIKILLFFFSFFKKKNCRKYKLQRIQWW